MINAIVFDLDALVLEADEKCNLTDENYDAYMASATDYTIDPVGALYTNVIKTSSTDHIVFVSENEALIENEVTEILFNKGFSNFDRVIIKTAEQANKAQMLSDLETEYAELTVYNNLSVVTEIAANLN